MKIRKAWGSHLPVLMKVLSITEGDVLELGMGLYSSPFLYWACFEKRKLVSYDNDPKYFHWNKEYESPLHEVYLVEDWDKIDIEKPWDVVLVDHAPAERRIEEITRLSQFAKYVVVHDTQKRNEFAYHYSKIYPLFKYHYKYRNVKPHTSVLSNFVDVTKLEL